MDGVRRDGASRWGIYRDVERADVYLETFIRGAPRVRHLIDADSEGKG
jgi:hypothetical protein